MPGYYYGIDYSYIVFVLPALIFALWAQFNVKTTFAKYSRVSSDKGMTGCDAARLILDRNGLGYVRIEQVAGDLTDRPESQRDKAVPIGVRSADCGGGWSCGT